MNGSQKLTQEMAVALGSQTDLQVVLAPPAPLLSIARGAFDPSIEIAAQNCSQGSFLLAKK